MTLPGVVDFAAGGYLLDPRASMPQLALDDSLTLAKRIVDLGREHRAEEPVLLDVRSLVDYTDFFLLLTGRSARQNQAIADHVVRTLKGVGRRAISKSGLETGSWICIDLGDVVVHVFDPATRDRYDLELLWADAPVVDVSASACEPAAKAPVEEEAARPAKKRRRAVRKAAVEDADAANAPDAERPPDDDEPPPPEPPAAKKKAPAKKARPSRKKAR